MAVFEYTAKDSTGCEFSGLYRDVENSSELQQELGRMGYTLLNARRAKSRIAKGKTKVRSSELVAFAYEFAGMYGAGLSVIRCLETFEMQMGDSLLKEILTDVRQRIETGSSLKSAFEPYRNIFSDFFVGMLDAGETGGKLSETLQMSAAYLEKQAELKSKVRAAFAYPLVVSIMCVLIVSALVIFVIPVFQKLYEQLHVPLPGPTLLLILISRIVRNYWYIGLPAIGGAVFAVKKMFKNKFIRSKFDSIKLDIPVFGKLYGMMLVSKFVRTFAMMASAGVSIVDAVDFAKNVSNNSRMKQIGGRIQDEIITGNSVAGPMSKFPIFPPMIVQLTAAGEEAGILPEMLIKGVELLDSQIDRAVKSLIMKIEPILSIIMGLVVGTILLGVYLPMFDYMGHIK